MQTTQKNVFVAAMDLESGQELTIDTLISQKVQTTIMEGIVDTSYIDAVDEEGNPITYKTKIKIPAGTIITEEMIYVEGEEMTKDKRIQEYNMISLPSQLEDGDYIDIRLRLATGEDYVVLSKKQVEQSNSTTIWLEVDEIEILTMDNAIIEAWMLTGSKLYAIEYTEPGLQEKAVSTFPISGETLELIRNNPNVLNEARKALEDRYTDGLVNQRNNVINSALSQYINDRDSLVESGTSTEIQNMQNARNEYVQSLGIQ